MQNEELIVNPLVSIVITSYNHANSIALAIESAIAQDYSNLEIIISDNHSTDNSMEVINGYSQNPRVKIYRNSHNIGMIPNFKKATLELAKGEFITYVSSDDYLCDNHFISDSMSLARKYPEVLLIFGKLRQVMSNKDIIGETDEKPFWLKDFFIGKEVFLRSGENSWISWGACILKRKELIDLKPFDNHHTSKDIEINLKLLLMGNACFINRVCYEQVIDFKNASLSADAAKKIQIAKECFEEAYQFALSVSPSDKIKFNKWRNEVLTIYFKQTLISMKISNINEFKIFLRFVKLNYSDIYSRINSDPRWKLMNAFYHPALFPILKMFSPKRYEYFNKRSKMIS